MTDLVEAVGSFGLWLTVDASISFVNYRFEGTTHAEC